MSGKFSSNISPLEMMEMNKEDAKQINMALGVMIEEIPSKITYIKNSVDEAADLIKTLKTTTLSFNINNYVEELTKDYDKFCQEVINYAGYYEIEIMRVIEFFGRQNSLDGSFDFDEKFFGSIPLLTSIMLTIVTYAENLKADDIPQLSIDGYNFFNSDDVKALGNLSYNLTELWAQKLDPLRKNFLASGALIAVESLYDMLYLHTDPKQQDLVITRAVGNGTRLVACNLLAEYVAAPLGGSISGVVATKLAGMAGAKVIGGVAGGAVGIGIVALGGLAVDSIVTPVVDYITGENLIPGTSIPYNGGLSSLYSDYVRVLSGENFDSYGLLGRTTSIYGINTSSIYCKELLQQDPIDVLMGLDNRDYSVTDPRYTRLENYLNGLRSIPKDCENVAEYVQDLTNTWDTSSWSGYGKGYIRDLLDMGFDPYEYAINAQKEI